MEEDNETYGLPRSMIHPMSEGAYRAHILGMCTKFMRTFLFNLLMLFVGIAIGMSFTIMHVQKAWKEKCDHDAGFRLEQSLHQFGINDQDLVDMFLYMQKKHHMNIKGNQSKKAKKTMSSFGPKKTIEEKNKVEAK